MTDYNQPDRDIAELLDQAGRWCQPRHPGWDTLLERLAAQEAEGPRPGRPSGGRRLWQRPLAVAAALLVMLSLGGSLVWLALYTGRATAANLDVEVQRRGIDVTVFSASDNQEPTLYTPLAASSDSQMARAQAIQGMGLVKDHRMVLHLKKGDNIVKFTDVAATMDPTSVQLTSETDPAGIQVVEQNFEFDLATGDALLKRAIERRVTCIGKDDKEVVEGFLLSYDPETLVLADRPPSVSPLPPGEGPGVRAAAADPESSPRPLGEEQGVRAARPKTQAVARRQLKAIRLDEMPKDLYTRPTLVWKLRAKRPGDHLTTLSYLCGNMVWQADYVATIVKSDVEAGDTLDLTGWVTIANRSGATYEQAGLKLIAGDVNRVRDTWAIEANAEHWGGGVWRGSLQKFRVEELGRKEFVSKDFFEYKLYALNQPSTIHEQEIKQLGLLQAAGIKAQRRFLYDPQKIPDRLMTELIVKNEKANGLGRPLPKGRVAFVALDADGESQFLGRDQIDHTPKDEELELKLGQAFDVVGDAKTTNSHVPHVGRLIETYEIRVRNHKDTPIAVRAVGHLHGYTNWQVTKTTDDYIKHDFQTLYFDFRLGPDSEKRITYTVEYQSGQ